MNIPSQKIHVVSRASWSCTECSRRKIRCDKSIPCQSCTKRGKPDECKRENGSEVEEGNTQLTEIMKMMKSMMERIKRIEEAIDEERPKKRSRHNDTLQQSPQTIDQEAENQDTSITIEYLALNKNRKLGILSGSKDHYTAIEPTTNVLSTPNQHIEECPQVVHSMMLDHDKLQQVLHFHRANVQWQHACIHSQTFDRQVKTLAEFSHKSNKEFWYRVDPLWLALLFAIQTITFHQMPSKTLQAVSLSSRQFLVDGSLMATLRCLEIGNYMSKPNFFSCQTIAILSICGHNVVDSNHLASLLAVGIKVAQMLNLHVLGAESSYSNNRLALEMGKRVWWSLVQQDYFAIPFRGVSLVHPNQHNTPFPGNFTDEQMEKGSKTGNNDDTLTLILKQRITSMTADILCRFFLNLSNKDVKLDVHVKPYEQALRKLIPDVRSPSTQNNQDYGQSLFQYLNISIRHKILVIHRAFCGRSPFRQSDLRKSQEECVHLARSILKYCNPLKKASLPGQLDVMWTTAYHAVAAATVLALDMFGQMNSQNVVQRRNEVQEAYTILYSLAERSPIAQRGVTLLTSLMQQYDAVHHIPQENTSRNNTISHDPISDMTDWDQYKDIIALLENNPDVGRLFDGTLGDPFA